MPVWGIVLLVIFVILLAVFIGLMIFGNKLRKQQDEQQAKIDATKQVMSMLIIDKKKMKLKDANLPKMVLEQTPKYLRGSKMPIVKAKIGPRIMTLMADQTEFAMSVGDPAVPLTVDGTDSTVKWSTENSGVVTVNSVFEVTAVASGKTTVTAEVDGQTLTITVIVW